MINTTSTKSVATEQHHLVYVGKTHWDYCSFLSTTRFVFSLYSQLMTKTKSSVLFALHSN